MPDPEPAPARRAEWGLRLLRLAAEGMVPVLAGCAAAFIPAAPLIGELAGRVAEKAIDRFGPLIVRKWVVFLRGKPAPVRQAAVAQLASLRPADARAEAEAVLNGAKAGASPDDLAAALAWLSAVPATAATSLVRSADGSMTLPPGVDADSERTLARLLPTFAPPYPVPAVVPGTQYRLEELLGTGGFGAVYRATSPGMQHLPLALKFCLDRTLASSLARERANLERLMRAGGEDWSPRLVRLYGYDLDHPTPYLVCEYVPGGDLAAHVARLGRPLAPEEAAGLVASVAEGLAFAHGTGLVHRDLKPANVLLGRSGPRLADFGVGGVVARQALAGARPGTADRLSLSEQSGLLRGAGTPLYMSPEQRLQADPDPRQDVYSLGVVWYQLLAGDVTREMHPGWDRELEVRHRVPRPHVEAIRRCVGWVEERPADGADALRLVRGLGGEKVVVLADDSAVLDARPAGQPKNTVPILEAEPAPRKSRPANAAPLLEARPAPPKRPSSSAPLRFAVLSARLAELDVARRRLAAARGPVPVLLGATLQFPPLLVATSAVAFVLLGCLADVAALPDKTADFTAVSAAALLAGAGVWVMPAALSRRARWALSVLAGLAVGSLVATAVAFSRQRDPLERVFAPAVASGFCMTAVWGAVLLAHSRGWLVDLRARQLDDQVARFVADFPDEAAALGGPKGLRDATAVQARLAALAGGRD